MIIVSCKTIITEIGSISTGKISWTHIPIIPYEYGKIFKGS
jgi:hypothetical protein